MLRVNIRLANLADAETIRQIYNLEVTGSTATLDLVARTTEEQRAWMVAHSGVYPVVVADDGGQVVGFASLSPYRPRPGYATAVEDSIYVAAQHRGWGSGGSCSLKPSSWPGPMAFIPVVPGSAPPSRRRLHCTRPAASTSSASSERSAASSAAGWTSPSCSASSNRKRAVERPRGSIEGRGGSSPQFNRQAILVGRSQRPSDPHDERDGEQGSRARDAVAMRTGLASPNWRTSAPAPGKPRKQAMIESTTRRILRRCSAIVPRPPWTTRCTRVALPVPARPPPAVSSPSPASPWRPVRATKGAGLMAAATASSDVLGSAHENRLVVS